LITSALGIVVAVPAFTFYSYLASFARTLMHDMERAGIEIVNLIHDSRTDRSLIVEFRPEPERLSGTGGSGPSKGGPR
jgi:biopolymer transport protein ExbB